MSSSRHRKQRKQNQLHPPSSSNSSNSNEDETSNQHHRRQRQEQQEGRILWSQRSLLSSQDELSFHDEIPPLALRRRQYSKASTSNAAASLSAVAQRKRQRQRCGPIAGIAATSAQSKHRPKQKQRHCSVLETLGCGDDTNSSDDGNDINKTIQDTVKHARMSKPSKSFNKAKGPKTTNCYSSSSSSTDDDNENIELPPTQITQRLRPNPKTKNNALNKFYRKPKNSDSSTSSNHDNRDETEEEDEELEIPRPLSSEDEELEIPYAQAFCNSQEQLRSTLETRPREPLRCGDVIQYWHPAFCVGHYMGRRVAQVLQTHPGRTIPLELDNGDALDGDVRVRRIYELPVQSSKQQQQQQQLIPHRGIARPIATYLMTDAVLHSSSRNNDGLQRQVERLRQIITQAKQEIENSNNGNGTNDATDDESLDSPKKYPARPHTPLPDRTSAIRSTSASASYSSSASAGTVENVSRKQELLLLRENSTNQLQKHHLDRSCSPKLHKSSPTVTTTLEADSEDDDDDDDDDDELPPSVFGSTRKSFTRIFQTAARGSTTMTAASETAQHLTTIGIGGRNTMPETVGVRQRVVANQQEESDDDIPPSALNLDRRRRQPPPLVQKELQPKAPPRHRQSSSSSSSDDDHFGFPRRQKPESFSGRKRTGLGFHTVQLPIKKRRHRAMKSFLDGSRDDGGGRPPRPRNGNINHHRHDDVLHDEKALKQQQRDEFTMLLQSSNNYKDTAEKHEKVPRHRRTPTLFRPTVAEHAHSSCHASSDETSNEDLPWVRKKKWMKSNSSNSNNSAPQLNNTDSDSNNRSNRKPKAYHQNTELNSQTRRRHLQEARGYSSISSVDDDNAFAPGSAIRYRSKPAAVLQLELVPSRTRCHGHR